MQSTDDQILVERIKLGDDDAFREIVERYKKNIYYFALHLTGSHYDAEDISQEVFVRFYKSIQQFTIGSNIHAWLYRVTMNLFIDRKRKQNLKTITLNMEKSTGEYSPEPLDNGISGDPERQLESKIIQAHIENALKRLSPKERAVFVMKHYNCQTIKEIANIVNMAEGTVKTMLFRGIKKMQEALSFYKNDFGMEDVQ